jgi:ParB family chromosome partitioning protein
MNLPLDHIVPADYARPLSEPAVEALMASVERLGLLQPILVVASKINRGALCDGWRIVAGHHRVEAHRRLGRSHIAAILMDPVSHLETELVEIDENLCRAELTPVQRAAAIKRRKQIWEALNPEGGNSVPTLGRHQKIGFAADTCTAAGMTKRAVNEHLSRAEVLGDDLGQVAGTSLDKGVELDALKALPVDERQALIARARKGEAVSARRPKARLNLTIEYLDVVDGAIRLARSIMMRDPEMARALRDALDKQLQGVI